MRLSLLFLGILAASSGAQGGSGGPRRPLFGGGAAQERPPELRTKEIVRLSPARVVLERARELNLTPEQFRQLDSLNRAYEVRAKDSGRALDTLDSIIDRARRDLGRDRQDAAMKRNRGRPENKRDSVEQARSDSIDQSKMDEHSKRGTDASNARGQVLLVARDGFDGALAAVRAILTEDQRTKFAPTFADLSAEFTQRLHWQNIR